MVGDAIDDSDDSLDPFLDDGVSTKFQAMSKNAKTNEGNAVVGKGNRQADKPSA